MRASFVPAVLILAASCGAAFSQTDVDWPMSLKPVGPPQLPKGSPCRLVANNVATAEFHDPTAMLVACPGARSSIAIGKFLAVNGGRVVAEVDGFTLIAVPKVAQGAGDKKIAGSAIRKGQLRCTPGAHVPLTRCDYSVIARRGGAYTVLITKPDGSQRAVFFVNGKVRGADITQADGAKKQRLVTTTELDLFVVSIGDERYEIPADAVAGGNDQ